MKPKAVLLLLVLGLVAAVQVFPLYWMLTTSVKPESAIFAPGLNLLPVPFTWGNYLRIWQSLPLLRFFLNSLLVAAAVTAGQLLTSLLAAYALSFFRIPYRNLLFLIVLGALVVPFQITMIPNYLTVAGLGWLNTYPALIVPRLASGFGIFLLRQNLLSFPAPLREAAELEGAGAWHILWRIVFPVYASPLAALGILLFLAAWNDYFWPLLVANQESVMTLTIGLARFISSEGGTLWGPLMAGATAASLPVLAVFLLLQRHIKENVITSGVR